MQGEAKDIELKLLRCSRATLQRMVDREGVVRRRIKMMPKKKLVRWILKQEAGRILQEEGGQQGEYDRVSTHHNSASAPHLRQGRLSTWCIHLMEGRVPWAARQTSSNNPVEGVLVAGPRARLHGWPRRPWIWSLLRVTALLTWFGLVTSPIPFCILLSVGFLVDGSEGIHLEAPWELHQAVVPDDQTNIVHDPRAPDAGGMLHLGVLAGRGHYAAHGLGVSRA